MPKASDVGGPCSDASHRATLQEINQIARVRAWFDDADFVVFDGGTGSEVEKAAGLDAMDKKGWSCRVNLTHPDIVREVHLQYLLAGADVVIANTYATNPNVMLAAGFTDDEQRQSTLRGCALAREAVEAAMEAAAAPGGDAKRRRPLVAGSLSCHPPAMPEGAEFDQGTWPPPHEEEANLVRHAALLKEGGVDLIFMEMVWNYDHAVRAVEAATSVGLPVFAAVCVPLPMSGPLTEEALKKLAVPGEELALGGAGLVSVADTVRALTQHSNVIGVNVHHTPLPFTAAALQAVRRAGWSGTLGTYPDHGTFRNPHWEGLDLDLAAFLTHCEEWAEESGCKCIGGCCGVGPDVIQAVHQHRGVLASKVKLHDERRARAESAPAVAAAAAAAAAVPVAVARRNSRRGLWMLIPLCILVALMMQSGQLNYYKEAPFRDAQDRSAQATRTERAVCGDHWAALWYFVADADSNGLMAKELSTFLDGRVLLRKRLFARYGGSDGLRAALRVPRAQDHIVSLADFTRVFKPEIVGTAKRRCPRPIRPRPRPTRGTAPPPPPPPPPPRTPHPTRPR